MTAVIRPICVNHSDFGQRRIALFGISEIAAAELNIVLVHCKTQILNHNFKLTVVHIDKAVNHCDIGRILQLVVQRFRLVH